MTQILSLAAPKSMKLQSNRTADPHSAEISRPSNAPLKAILCPTKPTFSSRIPVHNVSPPYEVRPRCRDSSGSGSMRRHLYMYVDANQASKTSRRSPPLPSKEVDQGGFSAPAASISTSPSASIMTSDCAVAPRCSFCIYSYTPSRQPLFGSQWLRHTQPDRGALYEFRQRLSRDSTPRFGLCLHLITYISLHARGQAGLARLSIQQRAVEVDSSRGTDMA